MLAYIPNYIALNQTTWVEKQASGGRMQRENL
jgi:hypothetical protein